MIALALVSLVGCGGPADEGRVQVHGSNAALIADATVVDALTRMASALDGTFVVVAAPQVNPARLSLEADLASQRLDEPQYWPMSALMPRSAHAITYFYTGTPHLLQIRYGRSLRPRARLAGLDYGPKYNELQQIQRENGTPDLVAISERITRQIQTTASPFYSVWAFHIVTFLDDDFLPLLAVPVFDAWEGMSSLIAVPVYNRLGALVPNYFVFAAALIVLMMIPFGVFLPIFARFSTRADTAEGVNYQANSPAGCGLLLAFGAFMLVAVYPLFGLLILSANQRAEDVLALKAMGVNVGLTVPAELGWFVTLLLAGITIVARLPQQLMTNAESDELSAVGGALKSLVVVPLAYFFLPAWTVVLATWLAAFAGVWLLMTIVWRARS